MNIVTPLVFGGRRLLSGALLGGALAAWEKPGWGIGAESRGQSRLSS